MKKFSIEKSELIAYGLIFIGVLSRLLPHPPNFTPVAAIALFAGAYLNKKYSLVIALAAMLMSDIFLGFHNTMPYVYASFIIIGLLGRLLKNRTKPLNILTMALSGSFIFFIITNFGVWINFKMYAPTLSGLIQCYLMAIPFYRNTILGDIVFTTAFFGAFELVKYYSVKKVSVISNP